MIITTLDSAIPNGPLIPDSVNFSANTTVSLKTNQIISNIISDNVATLTGGILSNLNEPINDNDAATKYYVDNLARFLPDGPQNLSIQINGGSNNFIGYLTLLWNNGLTLYGNFTNTDGTNGTISIESDNIISGLSVPTHYKEAASKQYVQSTNLTIVTKTTAGISQTITLTPSEIINTIMKRSIDTTGTIDQDILPRAADIIAAIPNALVGSSFSFFYHYVSKQTTKYKIIILYGNIYGNSRTNILQKGNYFYINTPDNLINIFPETIVEFQGSVISTTEGTEEVAMYVSNICSLYENSSQQITKSGLKTNNFNSTPNTIYNNSYIIYPVARKIINTSASYTYTYSDIKSLLLVRRGLSANTTDELTTTAVFMTSLNMGSGAFKMVIQNIDPLYSITIGSGTTHGWSYAAGSRTISPNFNGLFYIYADTESTTCTLYPYGIVNRYGA